MTKLTNLQKALASKSGKVCVTVIRDDVLKVVFGATPEFDIVEELQTLTRNECFELIPGSSIQYWNFKVSKPQSAFEVGKAIVQDLKEKGIEVEVEIGTGRFQNLAVSNVDTDTFLQSSIDDKK